MTGSAASTCCSPSPPPAARSARSCGPGDHRRRVRSETVRLAGAGRGASLFDVLDRDALASIGIDLDAVRGRSRRRSAQAPHRGASPATTRRPGCAAGCAGPVRPGGRRPRQRRRARAAAAGRRSREERRWPAAVRSPPGECLCRVREPGEPRVEPAAPSRPSCRRWARPARGCEPRSSTVTGRPADSRRRLPMRAEILNRTGRPADSRRRLPIASAAGRQLVMEQQQQAARWGPMWRSPTSWWWRTRCGPVTSG